jgi:hypothetical protein
MHGTDNNVEATDVNDQLKYIGRFLSMQSIFFVVCCRSFTVFVIKEYLHMSYSYTVLDKIIRTQY